MVRAADLKAEDQLGTGRRLTLHDLRCLRQAFNFAPYLAEALIPVVAKPKRWKQTLTRETSDLAKRQQWDQLSYSINGEDWTLGPVVEVEE